MRYRVSAQHREPHAITCHCHDQAKVSDASPTDPGGVFHCLPLTFLKNK